MSQPNAYRILEFPDGTGSNPVKKKNKENDIFIDLFIHCFTFQFFVFAVSVLNITINNFLVIYLWSIIT